MHLSLGFGTRPLTPSSNAVQLEVHYREGMQVNKIRWHLAIAIPRQPGSWGRGNTSNDVQDLYDT